ncbi:MAG TPA: hypothetical protein VN154_02090, partial [Rhizomicrobium sp.]|nr:hypothetical protein [Rhizomicrobium sp.]
RTVFRDMAVLFAASAAVWIVLLERAVTPLTGAILMGAWLGYIALVLFTEIGRPQQTFAIDLRNGNAARNPGVSALLLAVGAVCLFFGARFTTVFAVVSARTIHAPQAAFAATIVALGTALPALVATVASAQRGHSFAASTQVLASTIFNLLLLFGVVALMAPEPAATTFARFDIPVLMVGIALVAGFMLSGWRLTRWHGVLLLFGYLGYMVLTGLRCGAFSHGG